MSDYGVRACLVCGKEFEAKKPWALTCSETCREERKLILARRQGKKQREKTRAMLKDYKRLLAENEALKKRLADEEEYTLRYKGFVAEVSYDEERQEFCGVTKNAGLITFVAKTEEELEREFVTSVETWIAVCKEKGIEIPAELLVDVAEAAKEMPKTPETAKPDVVKPAPGKTPEAVKPEAADTSSGKTPFVAKPAPEKPVPDAVKPQSDKTAVKPASEEPKKPDIAKSAEENGERVIGDPAATKKFNHFVTTKKYRCIQCGALFYPTGNRQKYCPECRAKRVGR